MKVFLREPALWLGMVAAAVQMVSSFFVPLTVEQQALVNALAVAVAGVVTQLVVRKEGQAAAVVGFAQAVIALALGFGWGASPEQQAAVMAIVTAAAAMWTRTQVTAPVDEQGHRTY